MEDLYRTEKDWEADLRKLSQMETQITAYRRRLAESGAVILEALRKQDEMSKLLEKVYVYASQKSHEDMGNAHFQELSSKASVLMMLSLIHILSNGASHRCVPGISPDSRYLPVRGYDTWSHAAWVFPGGIGGVFFFPGDSGYVWGQPAEIIKIRV